MHHHQLLIIPVSHLWLAAIDDDDDDGAVVYHWFIASTNTNCMCEFKNSASRSESKLKTNQLEHK